MRVVLDASALLAYIRGEAGADEVEELLLNPETECYVHAVNLFEMYYLRIRTHGLATARATITAFETAGIRTREDMDKAFWQDAGSIKARFPMSPPDSFGVALARRLDCAFVSTDHGELDRVDAAGACRIRFLR